MVQTFKQLLKKYLANLYYFYTYLRYRILIVLLMSIMVGVLDGFGLAMFLPLLEMIADKGGVSSGSHMGNLSFIVDAITSAGFELNLITVLVVMLLFFVLKGGFKFLAGYFNVIYQQFFIRHLRERNIKALSNFSYENFVLSDAGRIQNTMSGEVGRVVSAYKNYMAVIQLIVMVLVYSAMAFLANPQFALLVFVGGILTNFLFGTLYKKTKEFSRKLVKSSHGFQGLLIQQVAFFKYLKATGLIKKYSDKLIEKVYEIENSQKKIGILNSIMQGVREPMLIAVVVAVIIIEVIFLNGSLGLIILSILFFYRALTSVMQLQTQWNSFLSSSGSLENLKEFVAELHSGRERNGTKKMESFKNLMQLKQVDFAYLKTPTLNNIDLQIMKNETVAFVGESGSGKTTLMNILSGLLKPHKGEFLIDGISVSELNTATYNSRIGYITQEPVIFDDTIFNNITFWSEKNKENLNRFYEALHGASIFEFVSSLEDKEDSRLGSNGINISGGQKQRISIARELYKDIDILIMDEATSSLDSETEKDIQNNIDLLKGRYTILIVAHRLSTIKNADRIVLMKNGGISQIGAFEELVASGADFKRMVELQELQ